MAISTVDRQAPIKLDLVDKKLLFELSQNYRISRKELAKKNRTSVQVLSYKIERLIKKQIISPTIALNFPRLDIQTYMLLVDPIDDETRKKILKADCVSYFFQCVGNHQYIILIKNVDVQEFCRTYLPNTHVEIHAITNFIPDDYNPFQVGQTFPVKKNKEGVLDRKDYILLAELCKNPAESLLKLSEKTKLDWQTVKLRLKKLEDINIIQKTRYAINIFAIGFLVYYLKINLLSKDRSAAINFVRPDCHSGFILENVSGIFMYYMPPSHRELQEFIQRLSAKFDVKIDVYQVTEALQIEMTPKRVISEFQKRSKLVGARIF